MGRDLNDIFHTSFWEQSVSCLGGFVSQLLNCWQVEISCVESIWHRGTQQAPKDSLFYRRTGGCVPPSTSLCPSSWTSVSLSVNGEGHWPLPWGTEGVNGNIVHSKTPSWVPECCLCVLRWLPQPLTAGECTSHRPCRERGDESASPYLQVWAGVKPGPLWIKRSLVNSPSQLLRPRCETGRCPCSACTRIQRRGRGRRLTPCPKVHCHSAPPTAAGLAGKDGR